MQQTALHLCVSVLAYTAGLAREVVGLLVPANRKKTIVANARRLRRTIVGHTKKEVARLLGPPPAAGAMDVQPSSPTYWLANTWYYRFNPRRQTAVAVRFKQDRVIGVEFIGG